MQDFVDALTPDFIDQYGYFGGVYLITTEDFWKRGICKVGIANTFNKRLKSFRSCYAFTTKIYVLGLIVVDDEAPRQELRRVEKEILKEFDNYRLPYPDSDNLTEWLAINPMFLQDKFDSFTDRADHFHIQNIITFFKPLDKVPPIDVDFNVIGEGSKYATIEYMDGTRTRITKKLLEFIMTHSKDGEAIHQKRPPKKKRATPGSKKFPIVID